MTGFRFSGLLMALGIALAAPAAVAQTGYGYGSGDATRDADNARLKKVMLCESMADTKGLRGMDKRKERSIFVNNCVRNSK